MMKQLELALSYYCLTTAVTLNYLLIDFGTSLIITSYKKTSKNKNIIVIKQHKAKATTVYDIYNT